MVKKINLHRKVPRWFKEQKERKKRSFGRFYKGLLYLFFFLTLIFVGFKIWSWSSHTFWDGRHNFNFVVWNEDQFYVVSYRAGTQEVNVLQVSSETYLTLAKGFGEYRAGSVWQLGELEKFGGGQLLQLSTQYFLGVPIQGWGKVSSKFEVRSSKITKRELLIMMGKLIFTKERNLSGWDLLRFMNKVRKLPLGKINFYSLDKTRAGEEIELPDGQRAFKINESFLDNLVKNIYKDMGVLNEGIIWVVVNKTQHIGLATQTARMIDNIGGEVTAFYEKPESAPEGIYCGPARPPAPSAQADGGQAKLCESYTVALLSSTLNLPIKRETFQESRAEAVIVLGEDYWQFFYQR